MKSKKIVFNFGVAAGFFSEYNNMILCYLYCLTNNIKFSLFESNKNFSNGFDWSDYFEPFCERTNLKFHKRYNKRTYFGNLSYSEIFNDILKFKHNKNELLPIIRLEHRFVGDFLKKLFKFDYFTYELFSTFRNRNLQNQQFIIQIKLLPIL